MLVNVYDLEIKEKFYSIYPEVDFMKQDWLFTLDTVDKGYTVISVYRLIGASSDWEGLEVEGFFEVHRNWEGRDIYKFGEITNKYDVHLSDDKTDETGDVSFAPERNSELYFFNTGKDEYSYNFISGLEYFTNVLTTVTKISNQLMNKENALPVENEIVLYPVTKKVTFKF